MHYTSMIIYYGDETSSSIPFFMYVYIYLCTDVCMYVRMLHQRYLYFAFPLAIFNLRYAI